VVITLTSLLIVRVRFFVVLPFWRGKLPLPANEISQALWNLPKFSLALISSQLRFNSPHCSTVAM
jgi:hypothetical protein